MQFFESVDFTQVGRGIPVTQENFDHWYIKIGVWKQHRVNDKNVWQLHGFSIGVETAGMQMVIGPDGVTRVMNGQMAYRNNRIVIAASEASDDARALLFLRFNSPPRNLVASSAKTGDVKRFLNADNVDPWCTYDEETPYLQSLMTVRPGSRIWVQEDRSLRVAGTGASLYKPFNFAQYKQVGSIGNTVEFRGVTFSDLDDAFHTSNQRCDPVLIEAWSGDKTATFTIPPVSEVGEVRRKAADALGLNPETHAGSVKYEEVSR